MRRIALVFAILPLPSLADTIVIDAPPTAVTAYAYGALVTRKVTFDMPAGQHSLRIPDMDNGLTPQLIDVDLSGAVITSRSWSPDNNAPYRAPRTPGWLTAKTALDQAIEALAQKDDEIAIVRAKGQAAQDQIDFLNGITLPDDVSTDVEALRAIGHLIASDGTAARGAMRAAETEARALQRGRADLVFAVEEAKATLDDATPPNADPATLTLNVSAAQSGKGALTLRYVTENAEWEPNYNMFLEDGKTLRMERGALISQSSAEDWIDVELTLSTLSPLTESEPVNLWPIRRRIEDKQELDDAGAQEILEEPVESARADLSGVAVSYTLPSKVTVKSGRAAVQIALDTIDFAANLTARAVPRLNDTAFRQVAFKNTSPEILSPGSAVLYVDGQIVGATSVSKLPSNTNTDIFFGPIEGLRVTRTVLDRNVGDRGIISRSNEEREEIRLEVENLTARDWQVDVRDSVPYSEQEDLVINWQANPAPDDEAVDDRRGILEWHLALAAGQTFTIQIQTMITWPEDKVLR